MGNRVNGNGFNFRQENVAKSDKTYVAKKPVILKQNPKPNTVFGQKKTSSTSNTSSSYLQTFNGQSSFASKTSGLLNKKYNHKTKLLDIAQANLGLIEVTASEYNSMSPAQKEKTQMKIVGRMGGSVNSQWCAYTVSYLAQQAGMNIGGTKPAVSQFVDWAQKRGKYEAISVKKVNSNNLTAERKSRADQIQKQLPKMHEGDFIVWKTNYGVKSDEGFSVEYSSHIGIIETVDTRRGVVTVIEGNANEFVDPDGNGPQERGKAHGQQQRTNGNQDEGDFREVNRRDGLIRKEYTIEELANFGYSGFIDNTGIVK